VNDCQSSAEAVVLDGVYVEDGGIPRFHELNPPVW
jgi:hypothetical protein